MLKHQLPHPVFLLALGASAWKTTFTASAVLQPAQRISCDRQILNNQSDGIYEGGKLTAHTPVASKQKRDACGDVQYTHGVFAEWSHIDKISRTAQRCQA